VAFKNHIEDLKVQEIEWARRKLKDLDEDEFKYVEHMGHRFASKVLHSVYRNLKQADPEHAHILMKSLHHLFPLESSLSDSKTPSTIHPLTRKEDL
jgi:glutamyl-tRNA reductase